MSAIQGSGLEGVSTVQGSGLEGCMSTIQGLDLRDCPLY